MRIAAKSRYASGIVSAIALAVLESRGACAFVPGSRHGAPTRTRTSLNTVTTTTPVGKAEARAKAKAKPRLVDILEDEKGHINPQLAQLIWKWEKSQRLNLDLPDFENYSTRTGLRWVKDLVKKTLRALHVIESTSTAASASASPHLQRRSLHDDLIQEGVIGLMQALKTFEHEARPNESFESFAKAQIQIALDAFTLERAKGMGNPTGTGKPLSMESTVEIADPLETESYYYNQDEWEVREGLVLDNGKSVQREELVEDFLDETLQYEGEDQMWIQSQSIAAPLRDSIPESLDDSQDGITETSLMEDRATSPDDLALKDMILYNVDDFLGNTLEDIESQIIQMRFGLDDGVPKTQKEIALELDLTIRKVRKLQKVSLAKLRARFTERYINDDTGHEDFWEDTV